VNSSILVLVSCSDWRLVTLDFRSEVGPDVAHLTWLRKDGSKDSLLVTGASSYVSTFGARLRLLRSGVALDQQVCEWEEPIVEAEDGVSIQICAMSDTMDIPIRGDRFYRDGIVSIGNLKIR
jgi:hypothetical protein